MTNETEEIEQTEQEEEFGTDRRGRPTQKESEEQKARAAAAEKALTTLFRIKEPGMTRRRVAEWKEKFLTELGDVEDEDFRHIMADPEVSHIISELFHAADGKKPGDAIYDDRGREIERVPYDANWMMENYAMVEWTPMKTEVIEVNGVPWRVYEGLPCKTPNIIRDVAQESYRAVRAAHQLQSEVLASSQYFFADGVTVDAGWHKMSKDELEKQPGNRVS